MTKIHRNTELLLRVAIVLAVSCAFLLAFLAISAVRPVSAGVESGGVTGWNGIFTLSSGAQYTDAVDLGAVYSADFGAAQIDLTIDVTGAQQVTLVPQFSNQPIACASVTSWFTATDYVYTTAQMTNTVQVAGLVPSFSQAGDGSAGREVSVYGRCLRVRLTTDSVGQVFTPTIYVRLLDRQ